jgi:hypothetical protein
MLCFAVGVSGAPKGGHGGGPGHGPGGPGPGFGPDTGAKGELTYVEGVIKSITPAGENQPGKIVVAKKDKDGRELQATVLVGRETQIFIGDEARTLDDLAVGNQVIASFKKPAPGKDPVAVLIRVPKDDKGGKKPADAGEEK